MTQESSSTPETEAETELNVTKQSLANGLDFVKISSENKNSTNNKRKLILHFDNRNTLQVANSVSATTIEQGVNNFLTGVLWGFENEAGDWEWISESPSLEKPENCPNCTTYFKYLENQIVKKAVDRKDLREKTGSFVQNEGSRFKPFYDELIEALRYYKLGSEERKNEDLKMNENNSNEENSTKQISRRFSVTHLQQVPVNGFRSSDGTIYHYIFPAFFRLIQHLQETKRDFVIYLRTMGGDSENFLRTVRKVVTNQHPSFEFEQTVTVHSVPGKIKRPSIDEILLEIRFDNEKEEKEEEILNDEIRINEKLLLGQGIHAIQDDFDCWRKENYHYSMSKPIWFDPEDFHPKSHHILFDDNFRVIDPHDCIVDIRLIDAEKQRAVSCPFEFYRDLENIFAVQADLYLLLADEEYFIKQVQICENNFDKLLQNQILLDAMRTKAFSNSSTDLG